MSDEPGGRERQFSRDRETIRNWADRHDVVPVRDERTEGESRYRMVDEESMEADHERVEWETFFDEFHEGDHVVVYHGETSTEPMELQDQGDVVMDLDDDEVEERLLDGETVTSTVTETAVVEEVITEELTIESELIETETIDHEVVHAELLDREVVDYELVEAEPVDDADWFDEERYLEAVGGTTAGAPGGGPTTFEGSDLPYDVELDVEERWAVARDVTEEYVVESEITGAEVTEAESLEDYDLDVEGLHRTIAESGIIEEDLDTEQFITDYGPESELTEDDRVTTSFTRNRTVEDEILDRKEYRGTLVGGEVRDLELVSSEEVAVTDVGGGMGASDQTDVGATAGDEMGTDATGAGADMTGSDRTGTDTSGTGVGGAATLTEDEVGKTVVDPTGDEIGTVTDVDEGANAMYVDPNPGLTERIKTALGWGDADSQDQRLDAKHVDRVDDDEIRLDHAEDLESDRR